MSRIVKGLFGGKSASESILQRFGPSGFQSAGGSASYDRPSNAFVFTPGAAETNALSGITSAAGAQASALGGLRSQVTPGLGDLTKTLVGTMENSLQSRVNAIRDQSRATTGNIRESLARRRLAGSSFQASAVSTSAADFARAEDQARADAAQAEAKVQSDAFLNEIQLNQSLLKDQFSSSLTAFQSVLSQLNFDTGVTAQLTSQASELFNANITAQAEARAAQQAAGESFLNNLISSAAQVFGGP